MNVKKTLFTGGSVLLVLALTLLLLEPSLITVEPDPRFDTEVTSFADGTAEFKYIPVSEESHDVSVSYAATVDDKIVEFVEEQVYRGVTRDDPLAVTVPAEPEQAVAVNMTIKDLEGKTLHHSNHRISGIIENQD